MKNIQLSNLALEDHIAVSPQTPIIYVAEQMLAEKKSCAIVTVNKQPIGILTEHDVVKVFVSEELKSSQHRDPVAKHMTTLVVTVSDQSTLLDALIITRARKVRHLPVTNEQNVCVGVVTHSGLNEIYLKLVEQQREIIERSVKERTIQLAKANQELKSLALEDHLLNIGNRRSMEVDLKHTHSMFNRYGASYALALLDLDCFKAYNDNYGHQAGDKVLIQVANLIKNLCRATDRLYRYGGEEFLLVMSETNIEGAKIAANRIMKALESLNIEHKYCDAGRITLSMGVSSTELQSEHQPLEIKHLISSADELLYNAKEAGRDQAMFLPTKGLSQAASSLKAV